MDEREELAVRLLTIAGAIMEDSSVIAIVSETGGSLDDRASAVASAAADAHALALAAAIVLAWS
jgi:hypothetical protein